MKIAVIGSGISGLSVAHLLSKKHKVDLFEKNNHFGGHSYTVEIPKNNLNDLISIDLGFIVFNKINYPNLTQLFTTLQVPYEKSNMSFSVTVKNSNIEYSGSGLGGLFLNKHNINLLIHGHDNKNKIHKNRIAIFKRTKNISSTILRKRAMRCLKKQK